MQWPIAACSGRHVSPTGAALGPGTGGMAWPAWGSTGVGAGVGAGAAVLGVQCPIAACSGRQAGSSAGAGVGAGLVGICMPGIFE